MTELPASKPDDSTEVTKCPMCGEVLKQTDILITDSSYIHQILQKCHPAILVVSVSSILVALIAVTIAVYYWSTPSSHGTLFRERGAGKLFFWGQFLRAAGSERALLAIGPLRLEANQGCRRLPLSR